MTATAIDPRALLRQHFGFDQFRPGQQEVIEHLLAGRSAAAVFPTGAGKSLCYQLPSLVLPGVTLVVSPLIALMKDQIDALAARGIAAQRLDSTLDLDGYRQAISDVRSGKLRLLYVAPERFNNERFRGVLQQLKIALFAVDEAHCISEWGHNFRPDYLKLAAFARQFKAERVLALTATATPKVLEDMVKGFDIEPQCAVRTGFYRPNLTLLTTAVDETRRDAELLRHLRQRPAGPTIVYVTLQRTAEQVAEQLAHAGLPAKAYHAGMEAEQRAAVQEWFLASGAGIVVATIAFGMGIDKADIRYVYHYNMPKSLENYAQEIGRAGRDGKPATCQTLACAVDLNTLENFIYGDTPTRAAVAGVVREVFNAAGTDGRIELSVEALSGGHDVRPLVARTLLTYLELLGHIEGGTPHYSTYRFKPRMPSTQILAKFEGERRTFLANMLRQARKAKTWFDIDTEQAARALGTPRDRVIAALDYLHQQQMLEVEAAGVRLTFTLRKQPDDMEALIEKLHRRTQAREAAELARLNQVVSLIERDGCQVAALGAHFGEERSEPCGHCTWCLEKKKLRKLAGRAAVKIDPSIWQQAKALRREHPMLDDPRVLTRLLCGVSSPALSKARLQRSPLFGRLEHAPFAEVLAAATEHAGTVSAK